MLAAVILTAILGGVLHCSGANSILKQRKTDERAMNPLGSQEAKTISGSQPKSFPSTFVVWLMFTEIGFATMIFVTTAVAKWTGSGLLGICGPYGPAAGLVGLMGLGSIPVSILFGIWAGDVYAAF